MPVTIPNTFQNQPGPIPLLQLDQNFAVLAAVVNAATSSTIYVLDSSVSANLITLTTAPGIAFSYVAGVTLLVRVANATTNSSVFVNVNGLGNKPLNSANAGLAIGQILAGDLITITYDGVAFRLATSYAFNGTLSINGNAGNAFALTCNGAANATTALFQGSTAASQSFGVLVLAGTNASDYAFNVANAARTTDFLKILGNGAIGFNAATPISKPTVTGSKAANAALTSLLSALAAYGLVVDSST